MRKVSNIKWNDSDITIKELTVSEVAEMLENIGSEADVLNLLFPDRLPPEAVVMSSGITREALKELPPSQLDTLWTEVEKINPFFHAAVKRLMAPAAQPAAP